MSDPFRLQRFVDAQDTVFDAVRMELAHGKKAGHWMWFVFPQIAGLGLSATSRRFAISSRDEAVAYLAHPVLGPRLRECCALLMQLDGRSAGAIFGSPDDAKLRSCMTLFAHVAPSEALFEAVLRTYYAGAPDRVTLDRLEVSA